MKTVHFRWSASEILCVTFVRWQAKLHPKSWDGKREKGWWGVGAVVRSSWAWNYPDGWKASRRHRLPRQHLWLAPHTELFRTREDCINHVNPLPRPTVKECHVLYKRRIADRFPTLQRKLKAVGGSIIAVGSTGSEIPRANSKVCKFSINYPYQAGYVECYTFTEATQIVNDIIRKMDLAYDEYVNEAQPMARNKEDFIAKVKSDSSFARHWVG